MNNLLLKAHQNHTVSVQNITIGKPHKIITKTKTNYELVDERTGYAPDHIVVKRVGSDLTLYVSKDAKYPDVIFESFYQVENHGFIGRAEDGLYYYYVPDTAQVDDYVTKLSDLDIQGHALGGRGLSEPWWVQISGDSPSLSWLGGLAFLTTTGVLHHQNTLKSSESAVLSKNQSPIHIELDNLTVVEGKNGTIIGKITTIDPDKMDLHTYQVNDERFEVVDGVLKLKENQKIEYQIEQSIDLTITTTDNQGASYNKHFILNVADDPDYPILPPMIPPSSNATISIVGEAKVGQTLMALIDDVDGVLSGIEYQWFADDRPILGAIKSTFVLTDEQQGKAITVQAQFTDNTQVQETPKSSPTTVVQKVYYDTVPPVINMSVDKAHITVGESVVVTFVMSETVSGFAVDDVTVTDGVLSDFLKVNETTYTAVYTATQVSDNATIRVGKNHFFDSSGNANTVGGELGLSISAAPLNHVSLGVYVPKPTTDFIANVKDFGAKGDGKTDDTTAIQKAIDAVAQKGGGIVDIPAGTYMINGAANTVLGPGFVPRQSGLQVKSNVIVRMADDTVLQVIPNGEKSYDIFSIRDVQNVAIYGGTLVGDRNTHLNNEGEWGSGIKIMSGRNVVVENVQARDFWGDALQISDSGTLPRTASENITIYQLTADNNRRQGISIGFADKVLVENSVFKNTGGSGGTPPMAGIDIEPENSEIASNITIKNSQFENNSGYGIVLLERTDTTGADIRNVVIDGNTIKTGGAGIIVNNSGGHTISNNHISDIGKGWYYGSQYSLALNAQSHDNTVSGNTVIDGSIIDRGQNNTLVGNTFQSVAFVRGEAKVGAELLADVHNDDGTPHNLSYQWYADGKAIKGATGASYTILREDAGKRISVEASFNKDGGERETVSYEVPSAVVVDVPLPMPNPPANQAPTDITLSANGLPENKAGAVIGNLTTTDPDTTDTHTYTVSDNRFEVVNGELKLKAGEKVEFATEPTINLNITTTDKKGASYQEAFTLQVQDDLAYPAPPVPNPPAPNPPPTNNKLSVYVPKPTTDFIANVKDFGAKGDGKTDDTTAIQKAIDAVAQKGGGVVDIPYGVYLIDGVKDGGISLRSNVTVRMTDDTTLKAIANDKTSYAIFRIHNVENAHVLGGTLIGERNEHLGNKGEGGYGVWVKASHNVVIENVTAKDFWGDGFLVSRYYFNEPSPENVVFYKVTADNNRRQGMSITDGNNIKVIQSVFKNTYGTDPQSGIDIEPNRSSHSPLVGPDGKRVAGKVTNVEVVDSVFENNAGYGVIASANGDAVIENVRVINNRMDNNYSAITFNGVKGGEIIGNSTQDNGRGIAYFDVDVYKSQGVVVKDNTMYGGKVRTYEAGSLSGENHHVSNNHTKAAVFIKGALKSGETVFAQVEDGDGVPFSQFIKYQWLVDGKEIAGANARTYTIHPKDSEKSLSVQVAFTDGSKQSEIAYSKPTPPIDSLKNNSAPSDIVLDSPALEVTEGKAGAHAGRVRAIDGDRGDDHIYYVSDERFEIDAYGLLKLKSSQKLDFFKEQNINLDILATDRAGNTLSKPFVVTVQDDPNYSAPKIPNKEKLAIHVPKPTTDFVANARDYGAKGDGKTDDTLAIQKAINEVSGKGGGIVEIPSGIYMIDTTAQKGPHSLSYNYPSGLMMKNNVILKLADDTVLKAIPTDQYNHNLITFYKADNAHMIGGTVMGERYQHQGIKGQWGYGVRVISSKDVVIENVTAKDFWGDGFYVGINSEIDPQSQNIMFYNVIADNNRRQGLSITDAKGVKVFNSVFKNTNGHMPISGIDVEPNPGRSTTEIDIVGNRFEGNLGFGVVISGGQFNGKNDPNNKYPDTITKNINIENNQMIGNNDGIWISGLEGGRVVGNTIRYTDITTGPTGGIRKLLVSESTSGILVKDNTIYGGGHAKHGGGIENLGSNNTVQNNHYKADVYIRGQFKDGEKLTAHVFDGDVVPTKVYYQWLADGQPITGANTASYQLGESDYGKRISVRVEFTDGMGQHEIATSLVSNPIGSTQPNHAPYWLFVQGEGHIEQGKEQAVVGKIGVVDKDISDTHTYYIDDKRFEVVDNLLKLKAGHHIDINEKLIPIAIEVTDSAGHRFVRELTLQVQTNPKLANATQFRSAALEDNHLGVATLQGEVRAGQKLTALVEDKNGILEQNTRYQWLSNHKPIAGQTAKSYVLTSADVDKHISVQIDYTDNDGYVHKLTSLADTVVGYGIYQHPVYGQYLKLEEFGADLTGKTDSSAAIKRALAQAHTHKAALYFGAGQIYISEQIKLDDSNGGVTALFGEGKTATTIVFDWQQQGEFNANTNKDDVSKEAGILIDGQHHKTIAHLGVLYQHKTPEDFYRTNEQGYGKSYFGKVNGIVINDASYTTVDDVSVRGANRAGVHFTSSQAIKGSFSDKLYLGHVDKNNIPYGEHNQVINSDLSANRVAGVLFAYQKNFLVKNNTLSWNGHEKDGGTGYGVASMAGSYNDHITYQGNATYHNYRKGLDIHDGEHILIEDNVSNGDRLYGIAVYNRSHYMGDVVIKNNTIIADSKFRLPVDDGAGDKSLPQNDVGSLSYHGYSGIQLQTNTQNRDFGKDKQGQYIIQNNTIKGLSIYQDALMTYGIEFRNHEAQNEYTVDISNNHISGDETRYGIAVVNNTNTTANVKGLGSGVINITNNIMEMAKVSGGVPIYVNEKEVHQAAVRGEVHIDNNHLTITHPYGDNQAIQVLGNAKLYTVNNNTLLLTNNPDKPVIGFYGSGLEQKPTLQVDGNHIVTANKPLFANWVQSVMQDKLGNAYDGAMQITNNTHSKNGEVSALNDTLVFAQDQGQFVFFAPNVNTDELKQLILMPNTQALLEHIGQVGNDVFVDKATNHTHHIYGSRGDDVLIVGGGGHELMGGVGKDQFVFVSSHKSATQIQLNTIMDFDKQNDLIKLVCGDKERIDNVNFDRQKKLLSYDVHHDGAVYHHHILINPKQQVLSEDVLNAIQII